MSEQQREGGRRPRPAHDVAAVADVLARLAAARGEHELLTELAVVARQTTGADQATVFVVDADRLVPVIALGEPIDVSDAVRSTTVDIRAHDSRVLVPIQAGSANLGVLALDWHDAPFERDDVRLLEAVAAHAGAAILAERDTRAAESLARARTGADVAAALHAWLDDDRVVAVAVLDAATATVTCTRGGEPWSGALPDVVADGFVQVFGSEEVDAPGLLVDLLGDDAEITRCLAVPLRNAGRLVGGVVAGATEALDVDDHRLAAISTVAGAAVARIADDRARMQADLRDVAGQLLGALSLLARHHAEVLPVGSSEAKTAQRLAELASAGRWSLEDDVRRLRNGTDGPGWDEIDP